MSKIRTIIQLQDKLDEAFSWRIQEVSIIKTSIDSRKASNDPKNKALIRAGVPLIYAHWEGFIKQSSGIYLSYVGNQGLTYRELKSCFIAFGLKRQLNEVLETKKHTKVAAAIDFIRKQLDERVNISSNSALQTSNLSSAVFEVIAESIGIDIEPYKSKFAWIDESLLERRNKIAHGEYLDLKPTEFPAYCDNVIHLMRMFKTDIENAVAMCSYKMPLSGASRLLDE